MCLRKVVNELDLNFFPYKLLMELCERMCWAGENQPNNENYNLREMRETYFFISRFNFLFQFSHYQRFQFIVSFLEQRMPMKCAIFTSCTSMMPVNSILQCRLVNHSTLTV